jgi:hypothetical protein
MQSQMLESNKGQTCLPTSIADFRSLMEIHMVAIIMTVHQFYTILRNQ